jgi:hypothetical protein
MRYTSKINFDAKIPNGIDLTGTGLSFAMVGDIPCGYYGEFEGNIKCSFYMLPITIPKGFRPLYYDGDKKIIVDNKENSNEQDFQIMFLSDIIEENETLLSFFSTLSLHNLFHGPSNTIPTTLSQISACNGNIKSNNNRIYFYEWGENYCIPMFFPNLTIVYYKILQDDKNEKRLEAVFNKETLKKETDGRYTKAFSFTQDFEDKITSDENTSGAMFMDNLCIIIDQKNKKELISLKTLKNVTSSRLAPPTDKG